MTEQQTADAENSRCRQCEQTFGPGADMEVTSDGAFCRHCFNQLAAEVETLVRQQSRGINYTTAVIGGLAGAVAGAALWWGFTVFQEP